MKAATKNDLGWLLLGAVVLVVAQGIAWANIRGLVQLLGLLFVLVSGGRLIHGLITAKDD